MSTFILLLLLSMYFYSVAQLAIFIKDWENRFVTSTCAHDDWERDRDNLRIWFEQHPFGAINEADRIHLENLLLYEIGSYSLYRLSLGQSSCDAYAESLFDELEDLQ